MKGLKGDFMMNNVFKTMCVNLVEISKLNEPERERHLNLFMSQGYLFLNLTDKQVYKLKELLKAKYSDLYIQYSKPDENGFTSEFMYLRFK